MGGKTGATIAKTLLMLLLYGGSTLVLVVMGDLLPIAMRDLLGYKTHTDGDALPGAIACFDPSVGGDGEDDWEHCPWYLQRKYVLILSTAIMFPVTLVREISALRYTSFGALLCISFLLVV